MGERRALPILTPDDFEDALNVYEITPSGFEPWTDEFDQRNDCTSLGGHVIAPTGDHVECIHCKLRAFWQ